MNETMKMHLYEVRGSLIKSVRELAPHRVREIRELNISREKNTPVRFLIRVMADEIRRISRNPEIGPVRPLLSDVTKLHD